MQTLSVVVSVRNDEQKIERALRSVLWAREIIVVNNSSTDKTGEIVKKYATKIFNRPNNLMLNINKNFGFSKATSDWILSLDSDEEIPELLSEEIREILSQKHLIGQKNKHTKNGKNYTPINNGISGYWIPRKNIIFGKWIRHGLWWPDKQLRLFQRGKGKFPCKHVHEYLDVEGKTAHLSEPFIHYNYDSISQYLYKMDTFYTESEVEKLISADYQFSWYDAVRFPISDFIKIYFAQEGYKDGLHGLVLSLLQAFYSFIVFAKLWQRSGFQERDIPLDTVVKELQNSKREISYWVLSSRIKQAPRLLHRLFLKIKRRYVR